MRTHLQILSDAGTDGEIAARLGLKAHQPRDWRIRKSIPADQWIAFSTNGLATLEELAEAAAERKRETASQDAAA